MTKILNQAFYMNHTFDSEVSLHYWMLWRRVGIRGPGHQLAALKGHRSKVKTLQIQSGNSSFQITLAITKSIVK